MTKKIKSGTEGLDEILKGGLIPDRTYLVQGGPGTGKSTLGYQFLEEGNNNNESTLLISLHEKKENIIDNVFNFGINISASNIVDLSPSANFYSKSGESYGIFSPSDVEQMPFMQQIKAEIEQRKPSRLVLDSITMLNMLSDDLYQARKLALSFIGYLSKNDITVMMISEQGSDIDEAAFWVNGVIKLRYDSSWRRIEVTKFRGSDFQPGEHAYKISDTGLEVFPKLSPNKYKRQFAPKQIKSGIGKFDDMLNGGLERGSTTLLSGPSGIGKTNLGIHFIRQAALEGERSAIYTFEESSEVILRRAEGINIPLNNIAKDGHLKIESVEPFSYSPDEFTKMVRNEVEKNDTRIVMIDSIGGYRLAVGKKEALIRIHSLCVYLQNMGVTTLLINEASNPIVNFRSTDINASYLSDNIIFFKYKEHKGELLKSIGILKKRLSDFDSQIRQFQITSKGIIMGQQLQDLSGVLTDKLEITNQ